LRTANKICMALLAIFVLNTFPPHQTKAGDLDPVALVNENPDSGKILTDVPFIEQKRYDCGPASVAMVLQYHGVDADADRIAKRFESEHVAGTFTVDLLIAASDAGLEAHWIEGDMEKLKHEIDSGRPPVVFLNLAINPLPMRHFAVAVGYVSHKGKDYIVLHSGYDRFLPVPERKFKRQWKRTGKMMMTVEPKKEGGK